MIRLTVRGLPAPQGSKRHVGGGRMVESSKAVGPWRDAVRTETQRAIGTPMEGPVNIHLIFWLPRPASAPKRVKVPAKRPDLDKLVRSTLDGLTEGGAWRDDAQVVGLYARKVFAAGEVGCNITLEEL